MIDRLEAFLIFITFSSSSASPSAFLHLNKYLFGADLLLLALPVLLFIFFSLPFVDNIHKPMPIPNESLFAAHVVVLDEWPTRTNNSVSLKNYPVKIMGIGA